MAQVVWSRRALADLVAIRSYIEQFSPLAAQRLAARLKGVADTLHSHPERGRMASGGMRELTVIYPYILRYRLTGGVVSIVRIRHGARQPD